MQVYFKNNFVSMYYDKAAQVGKAVWRGRLQGPELREAFLLCLDLIDRHGLTRWLADDRLMEAMDPADLEWSLKEFLPQLTGSLLQRMAWLPSHFVENREAVEVLIEKGHTPDHYIVHRTFYDEQEAMAWLMEPL